MKKRKVSNKIILLIIVFVLVAITTFVCSGFETINVNQSSMEPNISDEERGVINTRSYDIFDPRRFDVIVFAHEYNGESKHYIKRIIALPGETITYKDDGLYINGEKVIEDFLSSEAINGTYSVLNSTNMLYDIYYHEYEVPEDSYFVMGDNRFVSNDSRFFGFVTKDEIEGKVFLMLKTDKGRFRFV